VQRLFDFLSLTFAEMPEGPDRLRSFSVSTQFPKVELTDMAQTIEAAVSLLAPHLVWMLF
jgi:hypothetical protein